MDRRSVYFLEDSSFGNTKLAILSTQMNEVLCERVEGLGFRNGRQLQHKNWRTSCSEERQNPTSTKIRLVVVERSAE